MPPRGVATFRLFSPPAIFASDKPLPFNSVMTGYKLHSPLASLFLEPEGTCLPFSQSGKLQHPLSVQTCCGLVQIRQPHNVPCKNLTPKL